MSIFAGELYSYSYSPSGRLESAVSPSGEWLTLTEDERCLVRAGHSMMCLTAHLNGQLALNVSASPSTTEVHQGQRLESLFEKLVSSLLCLITQRG